MIKIVIEKTIIEQYDDPVEFVVERIPTEHREKSSYSGTESVVFHEKREPKMIRKQRKREVRLLEQGVENDADFDLAAVIKAINKL